MAAKASGRKQAVRVAETNAKVTREASRLSFAFSGSDGVVRPSRSEFRDPDELVEFLADTLRVPVRDGGIRATVRRSGKYARRREDGEVVATTGDPILDLITDEQGDLIVAGQRLPVSRAELGEPKNRMGGVSTIDLAPLGEDLANHHVRRAAMGEGEFVLVSCRDGLVSLASTNPSQRDFFRDGDHLRFKAWKKNRFLYWSMGAEIETWGHDFERARIESRYLDTVVGQTCATVKEDSDEDTDDDYVDEYEWGVRAPQPLRVVSRCTARWKGQNFSGQVEAGPVCFEV